MDGWPAVAGLRTWRTHDHSSPGVLSRRWWKAYQEAEERYGCGCMELFRPGGSRKETGQLVSPTRLCNSLEAYLQTHYATPQAKITASVYRLYREKCGQQGIPPVSERTFFTGFAPHFHYQRGREPAVVARVPPTLLPPFCLVRSNNPSPRRTSLCAGAYRSYGA